MNVKKFNQLKKDVKKGNVKGLNQEVISELTLKQAQLLEDAMMDIELDEEKNEVLDELVAFIDSLVQAEKVANKKAPTKPEKAEKVKPEKAPKKETKKETKKPEKVAKPFDKIEVGDIIQFQVEGEEVKHNILIVYKGTNNIIAIMKDDEREVFNIRRKDFDKGVFEWTDRHGETYNIIVIL